MSDAGLIESFPLTPMDVTPAALTALNAYSTW
ncbi:hypothetical protein T12_15770 [Trichinella patagoniensis]|uniref:Uncharacterized protein n=1 Tax=Trichinella patagoniensis TaxID=990121 RepID=A0A0V0XWE7_9BILA|nr:hypothetical protein T12_15770 [Trichinella patagoniensis]